MVNYISTSPQETENFAKNLASSLRDGDVLAYCGGLGVGKTAFTRGLAQGLGITASVTSPTFALVHSYTSNTHTLVHFDMYRVNTYDDLYSTGFFDYVETGAILAIEWSENIWGALPENFITVTLEVMDESTRKITVEGDERF